MTVGQIIDAAFRIYRQHFLSFFTVVLVLHVLPTLLLAVVTGLVSESPPGRASSVAQALVSMAALLGAFGFQMVALVFVSAVLTKSASEAYLGVEPGDLFTQLRKATPFLLRLLGTILLEGLLIGVASMFCLVPGIWLTLAYATTPAAVALEELSPIDALRRSRKLTKGSLPRIAGINVIITILSLLITGPSQLIVHFVSPTAKAALGTFGSVMLGNLICMPFSALALPLGTLISVILYYDLRIRKEGFDLEMLASNLNAQTQSAE
jgi:hypothetical protein